MKWALQHVKVTLQESDSGETLVIEQRPDGKVSCKSDKSTGEAADKRKKAEAAEAPAKGATKPADKAAKPAKEKKPEGKPAKAEKSEGKAATPSKKEPAKANDETTKPPREPAAAKSDKPARARRTKSLEWGPIKRLTYDGFAARSGNGQFEALHAKDSQWALFYKHQYANSKHLGCFPEFGEARKAAQAHHDRGMPEPEGITEEEVILLCPMPAEGAPAPANEPAPAAPATDAPAVSLTPELRAEMMSSMKDAIRTAMEGAA